MKETLFYKKLSGKRTQCQVCEHKCLIQPGQTGICGTRKNIDGKLYSLVYGKAVAVSVDPIEKKPLFHFLPASKALSFATIGCNFQCLFCQNYDISQLSKVKGITEKIENLSQNYSPTRLVQLAEEAGAQSVAYTYTEPTIFVEYALDTMKLARRKGLKNLWISNGFMSLKTLDAISPYLDAANIDLKSFSDDFYRKITGGRLEPVLRNLEEIKKRGIWLEVTTLLIPGYNDSPEEIRQVASFIRRRLGKETPWHISRFYPAFKMQELPPTPVEKIEQAVGIGRKAGLSYVYAGNVPGSRFEDTYCPKCGEVVISRIGYEVRRYDKNGRCPKCRTKIDLILK